MVAATMSEKGVKNSINAAVVAHLSTLPPTALILGMFTFSWARAAWLSVCTTEELKTVGSLTQTVLFRFRGVRFLFQVSHFQLM